MTRVSAALALALSAFTARAEPTRPFLHGLFTDDMILQRDAPCPVWAWTAEPRSSPPPR